MTTTFWSNIVSDTYMDILTFIIFVYLCLFLSTRIIWMSLNVVFDALQQEWHKTRLKQGCFCKQGFHNLFTFKIPIIYTRNICTLNLISVLCLILFAEFPYQIFIESIFLQTKYLLSKTLEDERISLEHQTWFSCLLDCGWGVLDEENKKCSYNNNEFWTKLTEHSATVNGTFRDG